MIPPFPAFAPLTMAHAAPLDHLATVIGPYSDLTFASLWCWNTESATALSLLHGNLVIAMRAYADDGAILTFAGMNRLDETITALLDHAADQRDSAVRLVPEPCLPAAHVAPSDLAIAAEEDHADYLYDLGALSALAGSAYRHKRNNCRHVERAYRPLLGMAALDDRRYMREALRLAEHWLAARETAGPAGSRADLAAIERCFCPGLAARLTAWRLLLGRDLAAFAITERLAGGVCLVHFLKADPAYRGLADYLLHTLARAHLALGDRVLNSEQDLGLPGLRTWKWSWQPCGYLRKYRLARRAAEPDIAMSWQRPGTAVPEDDGSFSSAGAMRDRGRMEGTPNSPLGSVAG